MASGPARHWEPGEVVLGLYGVLDVVHSGGMGLVHRVHHLGWQVDLAVKTPRPELVLVPEVRSRFEDEAGSWVRLGLHPHTVNCVYVRTIDELPRVFAEWVDGGSLAQAVSSGSLYRGGRRSALGRILDLAVQVAWGLAHAHQAGLIHQDVKPANVMLEPDGTAKVTDFGLASALEASAEIAGADPPTASFAGLTPAYCSPEQADAATGRRGAGLTTATDVWSWAVTVLEMFAGHQPSSYGQAAGEALETFLDGGAGDSRIPEIPQGVATLLRECFAHDPSARPSGLDEVAVRLGDLYRDALGTVHERPAPKAAHLLADGLSNQALSLLDLGRAEEAEALWLRAVRADPHHLPAVYNSGLHNWRSGRRTGEELVSRLEAARDADTGAPAGLGALLLGSVQLERHENERAGDLLREAVRADPAAADAASALAEWEHRPPRVHADLDSPAEQTSAVAVSADGNLVLSGDPAGRLLLWEPGKARRPRTLTRRGSPVDTVAVNAAGTLGAAARRDGTVEVWDLARGRRRLRLPKEDGGSAVRALAVSDDGRYIATGHRDGTIRVLAAEQGRLDAVLRGHTGPVSSLALSADGRRVLSGSFHAGLDEEGDSTVRSWDVAGGSCVGTFTGPYRGTLHGRAVHSFPLDIGAVSADARYAVVAWWDGPLALWDARAGVVASEVAHRLRHVRSIAVAAAGPTVLTAGDSSVPTQVWDAPTGRCLRTLDRELPPGVQSVNVAAISADGRVAVLAARSIAVRSLPAADYQAPWCYARPRTANEQTRTEDVFRERMERAGGLVAQGRFGTAADVLRSAQQVPGFARHPDLRAAWALVGPHGRRSTLLGAWPLYDYDRHGVFTQPVTLALSADGAIAATGRWSGEVDVWDFPAGERVHVFDHGEGGKARDIQFAMDGWLLLVLTSLGTIRLLSLQDGHKALYTNDRGVITTFALNPAGDRTLIGDETGTLRLRSLRAGPDILHTVRAHGGKVYDVALSPDCQYAATLGGTHPAANHLGGSVGENEVHLWPLAADRPKWTLPSRSHLERLDFSADGRTLFLSQGLHVGAWDVDTGKLRYSVRGTGAHRSDQSVISFSADRRLAATPDDRALRVWRTDTGKVLHSLSLPDSSYAFALSADGSFAVTGSWDRQVQVWDVRTGRCLRTMEGHRAPVHQMVLNRAGTLLATTDLGTGMWAWELTWDYDFPPGAGN